MEIVPVRDPCEIENIGVLSAYFIGYIVYPYDFESLIIHYTGLKTSSKP